MSDTEDILPAFWSAYAFYAAELGASSKVSQERVLAQTCRENAAVATEGDAAANVDGLYGPAGLEGRLHSSPLRHGSTWLVEGRVSGEDLTEMASQLFRSRVIDKTRASPEPGKPRTAHVHLRRRISATLTSRSPSTNATFRQCLPCWLNAAGKPFATCTLQSKATYPLHNSLQSPACVERTPQWAEMRS